VNDVDRQIVFICGLHRSGTSVLHRLLASHPSVSGFANTGVPEDEGQHLQSVYSPAKSFGGPGRFGFNARAHMDETHALASRVSAERIFADWARHWDLEARVLIEKSPPNIVRTRFLQALFPNALFVMVMRHPIAVATATEKWRRWDGIERLIEHWLVCHEKFEADKPHLTRSIVVRYEGLTAAPDQTLASIFSLMGLEPVPAAEPVRSDINDAYFRRWEHLSRRTFVGRSARRAVHLYGERVSRFGYSLHDLRH